MLKFSDANAKLEELYNVPELEIWLADGRRVYSLDLLSGWSCPSAKDCLSKVYETGNLTKSGNPQVKLKDGVSANHEANENLIINVTATDSGGLSINQNFTITVTDINEAPSDIQVSANSIQSNLVGATVGALTTIDEDSGEENTISISPDQIEIIEVQDDDDESGINIIERRKENQMAQLVLIGDIQETKDKSGNTLLNGEIKNIGTQRADFAKINVTFQKNWHGDVETLTAFVRGSYYTFKTGVTSDSSILPGAVEEFELMVPKSMGSFIGYSYTVDWEQYE